MATIKTEYTDCTGREYQTGDIVMNNLFGDIWIVDQFEDDEKTDDTECNYCLRLYGSKEIYTIELDEPESFEIIASIGDEGYQELRERCKNAAEHFYDQT